MMPSPLSALHDALVCGRLSCTELTAAYLDAAGRDNPRLNAYITLTPGEAMDTARRVDQKRAAGEPLRPLEGIPMALKDNLSTKGIRTTCASRMLEEYRPVYDAAAWMCVSALSEESISTGSVVAIPDFTEGKWITRELKDVIELD